MKEYVSHLLKALDLESYEAVHGKHFLKEDSSRAIASLIARLISAFEQVGESPRSGNHIRITRNGGNVTRPRAADDFP
jgi:hypothetical protein